MAKMGKSLATVTLGKYPNVNAYSQALERAGCRLSKSAADILGKMSVQRSKVQLELVAVSNAELGRPRGCTFAKTCQLAEAQGLHMCPAEVGPALRLQSNTADWLLIAMKPIASSDGGLFIFGLYQGGSALWLRAYGGGPSGFWGGGNVFVFARRKV